MKKHRNDMNLIQFNLGRFLQLFSFIILLAIFGCGMESGGDEDNGGACRILKYNYDQQGNVVDIEDQGSCDCEGYVPGEGVQVVCDATYNSLGLIVRGCVCEDEEIEGDTYVRFTNTLDCNGNPYIATFEVCGITLSSETGNWSSCKTVNSGNCTWTLSANTACEEIYMAGPVDLDANCIYTWQLTLREGKSTLSYTWECPGDCSTASPFSMGVSPESLSDDDSFGTFMRLPIDGEGFEIAQ